MGEALFAGTEPVLRKTLTLQVPSGSGLKYEMFNHAPAPRERRTGTRWNTPGRCATSPRSCPSGAWCPEEEVVPPHGLDRGQGPGAAGPLVE